MPRKITKGTGITAREATVYDATLPGDVEAGLEGFRRFGEALKDAGGLFRLASQQARLSCQAAANGKPPEPGDPDDSPSRLARKILRAIDLAEAGIERGEADLAADMAFQAGMEWAIAVMKWGWERPALVGQAYLVKSAEGRGLRLGDYADHTPDVLAEMQRLRNDGQSISSAARIVAAKGLGTSADANRALWQRHNKKPVTHP